jgi:N-carbamoylputrescine amidase
MAFFGMSKVFHVAAVQMRCSADRESNLENAERLVRAAAADGAQIVCLPEIFTGQYFCQSESVEGFRLAETIPGPSTERMQSLARELETVLVVPLFEKRSEGVYHNSAAIIDADGSLLGVYRKMHIPDDPGYYEKYYFTPGDLGFRSWTTHFGRIGVCICWDQWFPEAARLTAMSGAHVLFYPTAIGWHPGTDPELARAQHEAWQISMRAHSVANGCYVVAANRGGHEKPAGGNGIDFWGRSFISDPHGRLAAEIEGDREGYIIQQVDPSVVDHQRVEWPFFRDRRIDAYEGLTKRFLDAEDAPGG